MLYQCWSSGLQSCRVSGKRVSDTANFMHSMRLIEHFWTKLYKVVQQYSTGDCHSCDVTHSTCLPEPMRVHTSSGMLAPLCSCLTLRTLARCKSAIKNQALQRQQRYARQSCRCASADAQVDAQGPCALKISFMAHRPIVFTSLKLQGFRSDHQQMLQGYCRF